jgi:uncharacterized transporter YbjL
MPGLKKKLLLSLASMVSLAVGLLISYQLSKYSWVINLKSLVWVFGLFLAIIILAVGILFALDAWNCGRKKKDVRFR